jgi:hypothetical protein
MTHETHNDVSGHIAERDVDVYLVDRAVVASRLRFCQTIERSNAPPSNFCGGVFLNSARAGLDAI